MADNYTYGPKGPLHTEGMAEGEAGMPSTGLNCADILQRLHVHDFMDEIAVGNKYLDYAITLDNEGRTCIAKKFAEMGYEEYTHARVQRDILVEHGYMLTVEQSMAIDQLKHRIHTLFRG